MPASTNQPPNNLEAEQAVLGSLLIDPQAYYDISAIISAEQFFSRQHRWIYEAIGSLAQGQEPVDLLTISDKLEKDDHLRAVGGVAYIAQLIEAVPSALGVESYARIVRDAARRRNLLAAASEIARVAYDEATPIEEGIDRCLGILHGTSPSDANTVHAHDGAAAVLAKLQYNYDHPIGAYETRGIDTGYPALNLALDGWKRGNVYYVLGMESTGKTTFSMNCMMNVVDGGGRGVYFSLEQSASATEDPSHVSLWDRVVLSQARVSTDAFRTGHLDDNQMVRLYNASDRVSAWDLTMVDDALTLPQIEAALRKLQRQKPIDLVVIDYLGLISITDRRAHNRNEALGSLTRGLKQLARAVSVPIITPHQVSSKGIAARQQKRISLSDGYETGHLSQDADVVLGLNREVSFNPDAHPNMMALDVLKCRDGSGAGKSVPLWFSRQTGIFSSVHSGGDPSR